MIAFAKVRDAADAVQQKCPDGQITDQKCPDGQNVMNKAQARILEPLLKKPDLLAKAIIEIMKKPLNDKGYVSSAAIDDVATKYKKIMADERVGDLQKQPVSDDYKDWFVCGDMKTAPEIKDDYYDLVITSPPYNLKMLYDNYQDSGSQSQYIADLARWCDRMYRALKPGGRAFINLPNTYSRTKKRHFIEPLPLRLVEIMERNHPDMCLYQSITWDRLFVTDAMAANWGAYWSCSHPNLRRITESILVFAKGTTKRDANEELKDITDHEFVAWTQDLWPIAPENRIIWHPCPFPLEIPIRIMKLFGQRKDKILDCFGGSGTTAIAAALMDRECLSVDLSPKYTDLARRRMIEFISSGKGKKLLDRIRKRAENEKKGRKTEPDKLND
jgi:site-specific DNA-methyltransferase (adenine-specific)